MTSKHERHLLAVFGDETAERRADAYAAASVHMSEELAAQICEMMFQVEEIDIPKLNKALAGEPSWKCLAAREGFLMKAHEYVARLVDPHFQAGVDDRVKLGRMFHSIANQIWDPAPADGDYGRG